VVIEYNLVKYRDLCFARPENLAKIHRLVGTRPVRDVVPECHQGQTTQMSMIDETLPTTDNEFIHFDHSAGDYADYWLADWVNLISSVESSIHSPAQATSTSAQSPRARNSSKMCNPATRFRRTSSTSTTRDTPSEPKVSAIPEEQIAPRTSRRMSGEMSRPEATARAALQQSQAGNNHTGSEDMSNIHPKLRGQTTTTSRGSKPIPETRFEGRESIQHEAKVS
jgi:hypothetical protein